MGPGLRTRLAQGFGSGRACLGLHVSCWGEGALREKGLHTLEAGFGAH